MVMDKIIYPYIDQSSKIYSISNLPKITSLLLPEQQFRNLFSFWIMKWVESKILPGDMDSTGRQR
jgi:hypothetical protein